MAIVNFILDLAGLLLWLNWRTLRYDPLSKRTPATLTGTLRPAAPRKLQRWHLLAILGALLVLRAIVYRWVAPLWFGKLDLVVTVPQFSSNSFSAMLAFSFISFGLTVWVFYTGLLFLSLLSGPEPVHTLVKVPLGRLDAWPRWARAALPFAVTMSSWWLLSWLLAWIQILPPTSMAGRFEQSAVIGLASYLAWKFPAGVLLILHLLGSYIYFGRHPIWKYVGATSLTLMKPLRVVPLRFRRMDFGPLLGLALIFLAAEGWSRLLVWIYPKLPL